MIGDGDLETIFNSGDFDTQVVFTVAGPTTVTVRGMLTDATEQIDVLTGEVEARRVTVDCITSETTAVKRGNTATINAVTYTVERKQVHGMGVTTFYLKT